MPEKLSHSEIPLGSEWLFFGQDFGAKTDDLRQFDSLKVPEVRVLPGVGIGASYFREFMALNEFSEQTPDDKLLRVKTKIPQSLKDIEKTVLAIVSVGSAFVVRSSAIGEHGGTGIYGSDIVVRTGDPKKDLENFGNVIKWVYATYNRDNAKVYREKRGQPYEGMSLLVQPLAADVYKNTSSYPLLSGVMTVVNGSPTLRLVQGLGVTAVEMDEAIVLKRDEIRRDRIEASLDYLQRGKVTTWNSARYEYDTISFRDFDEKTQDRFVEAIPKLEQYLAVWRDLAEQGQPYYQEFTITDRDDKPIILQSAPITQKENTTELPLPQGIILCEGKDVVGQGVREGRGILWVGKDGFSPTDVAHLLDWNRRNKNYLLILPDKVFSRVGGTRVELRHFSNATGVVELQYESEITSLYASLLLGRVDHTHQRGGAHFTELCGQVYILFLGSERQQYKKDLADILGEDYEPMGEFSAFWDVPFKMVNGENEGWVEVVGKVEKSAYSQSQIKSWADSFWHLSNNFRDDDIVLENTCYTLCYFLADFLDEGDTGFNPVRVDQLPTEKQSELLEAIPNLRKIMEAEGEYGYTVEEYADPDLEKYFESIKALLVQALANRQN